MFQKKHVSAMPAFRKDHELCIYILEFSVSSPAAVSSLCLAGVLESLRVLLEKSFMTTEYKVTVGETVKNDRRGKETYQVVFLLRTCRKPA